MATAISTAISVVAVIALAGVGATFGGGWARPLRHLRRGLASDDATI